MGDRGHTRGEETVAAVAAGGYRTEDGTWVSIAAAVAALLERAQAPIDEGHEAAQPLHGLLPGLAAPEEAAVERSLLQALDYAHVRGVVHRDHARKNKICSPSDDTATHRRRTDHAHALPALARTAQRPTHAQS